MKKIHGKFENINILWKVGKGKETTFATFRNFLNFLKNPDFGCIKTFYRKIAILTAFYIKFAAVLKFFEKCFFLRRNRTFSQKNFFFNVFKKPYYFIPILRKICYNLVIKIFQTHNLVQLASKRKKLRCSIL